MLDNICTLVILYTSMNLPIAVWMMRSPSWPRCPWRSSRRPRSTAPALIRTLVRGRADRHAGDRRDRLICFIFSWNELLFARVNLTGTVARPRRSS